KELRSAHGYVGELKKLLEKEFHQSRQGETDHQQRCLTLDTASRLLQSINDSFSQLERIARVGRSADLNLRHRQEKNGSRVRIGVVNDASLTETGWLVIATCDN